MGKYKEIDFKILIDTFRKHFVAIVIITVVIALFGAGTGFIYTLNNPTNDIATYQELPTVDISMLEDDINYYKNYESEVTGMVTTLNNLINNILATESENVEGFLELKDNLSTFKSNELFYLDYLTSLATPYPDDYLDQVKYTLEIELEYAEKELEKAEASQQLLSELTVVPESEEIMSMYATEFAKVTSIPSLLIEIDEYKETIQLLDSNKYDEMVNDIEVALDEAVAKVNDFVAEFNSICVAISESNNLTISYNEILSDDATKTNLEAQVVHISRETSEMEDILAFAVFFALFGFVVSFVYFLAKTAKIS